MLSVVVQSGCEPKESSINSGVSSEPLISSSGQEKALEKVSEGKVEPKVAKGKFGPRMTFEKNFFDFGDMAPNSSRKCTFKFTNTGDSLLKVRKKIDSTCGCTVPFLKKTDYAPGESGSISVKFKAGSTPSNVTKRMTVHSNDGIASKIKLTIAARVIEVVDCNPESLKLILNKENAGCDNITLKSLDGKSFKVTSFKSKPKLITFDVNSLGEGSEHVLTPKVDMDQISSGQKGVITIGMNHPKLSTIPVSFEVLSRYSVNKRSIVVMNAEVNKPVKNEIWFLNNYNEEFEIESATSQKGYIRELSREKVGNRYKINLEVMPPPIKGKEKYFTDTFVIKAEDGGEVKILCYGYYTSGAKGLGAKAD
jgi:hypothetical protein